MRARKSAFIVVENYWQIMLIWVKLLPELLLHFNRMSGQNIFLNPYLDTSAIQTKQDKHIVQLQEWFLVLFQSAYLKVLLSRGTAVHCFLKKQKHLLFLQNI